MLKQITPYFLLFFLASFTACTQKTGKKEPDNLTKAIPPKPAGWVSDLENVFTKEQSAYLANIISDHAEKTGNQISIVTFTPDTALVKPTQFEQFSLALFRDWGIGDKNKNNGIGILFSQGWKKIRIETGYGLETKLSNREAQRIIDSLMVPAFKNGEYYSGILAGLQEIMKEIK